MHTQARSDSSKHESKPGNISPPAHSCDICNKEPYGENNGPGTYNEYFSVFGFPCRLMSDQAPEFSGKVITALCNLLGVAKIRTSPYHLQGNGTVARAHQTIQHMLRKMDPEKRRKWTSHLRSVIIAYNATRSLVTDPICLLIYYSLLPFGRNRLGLLMIMYCLSMRS